MKKIINTVAIIQAILLITALLCSCSSQEKETLYYSLSDEPITLDPQASSDENSKIIIMNIFEGLVSYDQDGNIIPAAAESYTVSEDGLNYVFTLRKDLKWSNGEALTSEDFAFGILRALSPEISADIPGALLSIAGAREYINGEIDASELGILAAGSGTLIIMLKYPDSSFLSALTQSYAMPCNEDFYNSASGQYGKNSDTIISNGTYKLREAYGWSHGEYLLLDENEYYVGENPAKCAGIEFSIGKEHNDIISAIEDGLVDASVADLSYREAAINAGMSVTDYNNAVWGIQFNLKDKSFLSKNMRLALLSALDRQSILNTLPSMVLPAYEIICDGLLLGGQSYRALVGNMYSDTRQKSYESYLNLGLSETHQAQMPEVTILCGEDSTSQKIASDIIEAWNSAFDVYLNKEPLSESELTDRITDGSFTVAIAPIEYNGSSPVQFLSSFSESIDTPEYTSAIDTAKNSQTSLDGCMQAEEYLVENGIFCPLYYSQEIFVTSANVSGIKFYPYGDGISFTRAEKHTEK